MMPGDLLVWLGGAMMIAGAVLTIVGAVGMLRLPDVFARMHAASLVDTLGVLLLLAGMILIEGLTQNSLKLSLVALFILFTSPVATHALAKAAIKDGVEPLLDDSPAASQDGPDS